MHSGKISDGTSAEVPVGGIVNNFTVLWES